MSASFFPSSTSSPSRAWKPLCSPNLLPMNPNLHRFKIPSSSSPPPAFTITGLPSSTAPVLKKRKRYRRILPGEAEGIVQEMRFVAMRLRDNAGDKEKQEEESSNGGEETWQPSMEGFLKYLVDSKLVFETIERIVDESTDVATCKNLVEEAGIIVLVPFCILVREQNGKFLFSCSDLESSLLCLPSFSFIYFFEIDGNKILHLALLGKDPKQPDEVYFRKTGLERASSLSKDLEWLSKREIIPQPSNPGTTYAKYLSQLAENNVPSFLCHFYNIYFAHITGGQEIGKKVCSMLLEGSELEFYKWDGDANKSLKDVRDNLNNLGEHWTREEKNTCLKEAAKSFRYLGQIVRLIIL
ncbi:hypothetical protein ZIOFF_044338 [Zingiber officinale]|uniref:Inactive heme oxygenase 2, chloroplastic n=1 Tax=Zingiber officinale TaxID=94328 RepID=A0A8J5FYX2_ZINOF|nr:hypothetical protein ZIOFF_044338 [Zingiber officinale]